MNHFQNFVRLCLTVLWVLLVGFTITCAVNWTSLLHLSWITWTILAAGLTAGYYFMFYFTKAYWNISSIDDFFS